MRQSQHQSPITAHYTSQSETHSEQLLWQDYAHKLSSIAGILSDSYWVTQGLSMLQVNNQDPLQSKTKQALRLLNSNNSKIQLIHKIIKNLSLCSAIEDNQQKLVMQVIKLTQEWEHWRKMKISNLHFPHALFGNGSNHIHQDDQFTEKMTTFKTEFDDRKLKDFGQDYVQQEKDIQI